MSEDQTPTTGPVAATIAEPPVTPPSPPGYELLHEIGKGGMGFYRARDAALDRDVAVKLLAERYPADSPAAQRFLSEARITGQLQHPGIPAVHQVGTLPDGRPFLAMKLIKGNTLEAILKQRSDPAVERGRLLGIFEAVCQAVGYAHAHRVIHRAAQSGRFQEAGGGSGSQIRAESQAQRLIAPRGFKPATNGEGAGRGRAVAKQETVPCVGVQARGR